MTPELEQIRNEILDLSAFKADIQFLEALANNAIYCLSQYQKKEIPVRLKQAIDIVITDVLNTLTKEVEWAKEEIENDDIDEFKALFKKAKNQILADINQLF
ncbi:hypothetical protein [Aureispira anguillae]|uniref:Uncharacterized protein n=1 Tax=Aureispira anguillae TaxID=2864201 RepID=A0A915YKQ3_9BACT|nr:hypothetical protein [Aureispira anguillae]BDS14731.1 hypothetical protein AsAng_0055130 [Aureispira anguillae]